MLKIILVLLAGAVGTGCRYGLSTLIYSRVERPTFPYANLVINVSGSFAIGLLAELFDGRALVSPTTRATLLPFIDEMVVEGLVTLEDIRVIQYRGSLAP